MYFTMNQSLVAQEIKFKNCAINSSNILEMPRKHKADGTK